MMNKTETILSGLKGRKNLIEPEVKAILKEYGISVPDFAVVTTENELSRLKLRFPVAMKVASPDILHKTDVGGVILNVRDADEMKERYHMLKQKFPDADILVESMEKGNVEVIIGLLNDPTFGMTIMFGLGGIFTEVYKDVVFRVVPISRTDAEQMLTEIKARKMLEGFRNIKTDRDAVIDTLLKVSRLGQDMEGTLDQMDANPVFVKEHGTVVVDAKMILR